jgi:DNA-binding NarL/FixJ family response regulator
MFRECLQMLLGASSQIRLVDIVEDDEALERAYESEVIGAVLFEAAGVPWNVAGMVRHLRALNPKVVLVGTYPHEYQHHQTIENITYIRRTSPSKAFVSALKGEHVGAEPNPSRVEIAERAAAGLTQRELQVLALISGGLTTTQIGERLGISTKTVENRRQSLFAKLGVQNQSHAVAVAMRTGLLGTS